jgi:hypothetical protein
LWLNATGAPAEVAAPAGNSARVLHEVYLHCIGSQEDAVSRRIEDALNGGTGSLHPPQYVKVSAFIPTGDRDPGAGALQTSEPVCRPYRNGRAEEGTLPSLETARAVRGAWVECLASAAYPCQIAGPCAG